jgi:hypothetical protein
MIRGLSTESHPMSEKKGGKQQEQSAATILTLNKPCIMAYVFRRAFSRNGTSRAGPGFLKLIHHRFPLLQKFGPSSFSSSTSQETDKSKSEKSCSFEQP